jgi:hypothetical protein
MAKKMCLSEISKKDLKEQVNLNSIPDTGD